MHYQPLVQTKEPAESSILLAQDPIAYIDEKLVEFCQQFMRSMPGNAAENRLIFSLAIDLYQIPSSVKLSKLFEKYLRTMSPSKN